MNMTLGPFEFGEPMIKVIKSRAEYDAALAAVEELMDRKPAAGSAEADQLEVLTLLVEDYEKKVVPRLLPDPVEAIRFRMEQQGLSQRDLVQYIGSKSKVSEILSGKRPLTLSMIRALHEGLGIPAEVLLQQKEESNEASEEAVNWSRYPLAAMVKRGWLEGVTELAKVRKDPARFVKKFFEPIGSPMSVAPALLKQSRHVRGTRSMDKYALDAWIARVMIRAKAEPMRVAYVPGSVSSEFMRQVVALSWFEEGPRLARQLLAAHGISLIVEPHLPGTHLDGAALLLDDERPVIGMTVRHDRLDNFWFCLLHELAHIRLHFGVSGATQFIDDVEVQALEDPREVEADEAAANALIPDEAWRASPASKGRAPVAIVMLAEQLRIHPSIVAGRIRRKYNDYRVLNELVGRGQVRKQFPGLSWD